MQDLVDAPCILPQLGSRTRQLVERTLKSAGITLNVIMQLPGTEAVKKAVEANLGIAFVSSYAVEREVALPVGEQFRQFVHRFAAGIRPMEASGVRTKGRGRTGMAFGAAPPAKPRRRETS